MTKFLTTRPLIMATLNIDKCVLSAHLLLHQGKIIACTKKYMRINTVTRTTTANWLSHSCTAADIKRKCCYYNKRYLLGCVDLIKTGVLTTTTLSSSCDSHQQKHQKKIEFL